VALPLVPRLRVNERKGREEGSEREQGEDAYRGGAGRAVAVADDDDYVRAPKVAAVSKVGESTTRCA